MRTIVKLVFFQASGLFDHDVVDREEVRLVFQFADKLQLMLNLLLHVVQSSIWITEEFDVAADCSIDGLKRGDSVRAKFVSARATSIERVGTAAR